jgi:hypothetical protein
MSETIRVLAAPADNGPSEKSIGGRVAEAVTVDIDMATLQAGMARLRVQVAQLFAAEPEPQGFRLKQVTAGIEITAEGGVRLIGSLTASAKAAVTLTFERD